MQDKIKAAADMLASTRSLFVLTGAGISAESNIPTFRGKDGLWKNYSATDLATPEAFAKDPELVWNWYRWRQKIILNALPNPGHYALVDLENMCGNFLLLTQNVDNLHQQAGSKKILELHGNIFRIRCNACGRILEPNNMIDDQGVPKCQCGGNLRPDVVWFGEMIPQDIWSQAIKFLTDADAVIVCGTSSVVWPAAAIPGIAKGNDTKIIEINLEPTSISSIVDIAIIGKSGEVLPEIIRHLQT